jgi:chorismate mutase
LDFLFDGLMIEVHYAPATARSDAGQQLRPTQYGKLLSRLRCPSPADTTRLSAAVRAIRKEIDAIDDDLITLLARRMECVKQIGSWKRSHNVSLFQLERWEHVLRDRVQRSVKRHLSENFARDLFEHIHEEALNIKEQIPPTGASEHLDPEPNSQSGETGEPHELQPAGAQVDLS